MLTVFRITNIAKCVLYVRCAISDARCRFRMRIASHSTLLSAAHFESHYIHQLNILMSHVVPVTITVNLSLAPATATATATCNGARATSRQQQQQQQQQQRERTAAWQRASSKRFLPSSYFADSSVSVSMEIPDSS
jgi:hypothetical protein